MKTKWLMTLGLVTNPLIMTISCAQDTNQQIAQAKVKWQDATFVVSKNEHDQVNSQVIFSLNLAPEQKWLVPETINFDPKQWTLFDQNNQILNSFQLMIKGFDAKPASIDNHRGWIWNPTIQQLQFVIDFDPAVLKIKNIVWQSAISEQVINFQPKLVLTSH